MPSILGPAAKAIDMEVGITIWLDRPLGEATALAEAAEAAGFAEVWLPDHYFLRDVFVAQALIAQRTTRIRIGTAAVSPMLRHPTLLASSTATINELSGGRAVIGIGPGGFEFAGQLGMAMEHPLTIVREATEIITNLLRGEAHLTGTIFTADDVHLGWTPGSVPIYLAARGPRMLELAGELADGVITHGLASEHIDFVRVRIGVGARRGGRPSTSCEICLMLDVELDDDSDAAVERLRPRCTVMVGGSYAEQMIPIYGLDPAEVIPVKEAVSRGDLAGATALLTPEMVRSFGVAGPDEDLAKALLSLEASGVRRTILNVGGKTIEEAISRVHRAGKVVAETFR
jgi:5,10-methylenetetrahydromethanopterin reductase